MSQVAIKSTTVGRSSGTIKVSIAPLVGMNVKLYVSCSEAPGSGFSNACPECFNPALQPRTCDTHGLLDSIAKVYRDGDDYFEITDADLDTMKLETAKNFVPSAVVSVNDVTDLLTQTQKQYYLVPDGYESGLTYAALFETLLRGRQVLLGKYSLNSGRETLAAILPDNDGLILLHLPFYDVRRPVPELSLPEVDAPILRAMKIIVNNLPHTFDYAAVTDNYDRALQKVILAKTQAKLATESKAILATVTPIANAPGIKTRRTRRNVLDCSPGQR